MAMRMYVAGAAVAALLSVGFLASLLRGHGGGSNSSIPVAGVDGGGGDGGGYTHTAIKRMPIVAAGGGSISGAGDAAGDGGGDATAARPCHNFPPAVLAAAVALSAAGGGNVKEVEAMVRAAPPPRPPTTSAPRRMPWVPVAVDYRGRAMSLLYVDRQNKLVHCNLRKNACSSWLQFLFRMSHPDAPMVDMYHIHWPSKTNLTRMEDLTSDEVEDILNDPSYSFFATVRDPIDRFASAYLDKCYRSDTEEERKWCGVPVRRGDLTTVDAVIRHIEGEQPYLVDHHFQQQNLMCGLRMLRDRFTLFRFEHMYEDAVAFAMNSTTMSAATRQTWLAAASEVFVHGERQWRDPSLTAKPKDILTPERVRWLARIYRNDYRFFSDVLLTE